MFTQATSCIFPFSLKTGVCFEDCCVVRGGFSAVLPLSHYSLVCHALYSEEEEMKSRGEQQWTDKMMKARHEEMIFRNISGSGLQEHNFVPLQEFIFYLTIVT